MPDTETLTAVLGEDGDVHCATCGGVELGLLETGTTYYDVRGWMQLGGKILFAKSQDSDTSTIVRCYAHTEHGCPDMDVPDDVMIDW